MRTRVAKSILLSAISLVVLSQAAWATGFALSEGSADWLANAFAGTAAKAYDASTAYSNPAGMSRLKQNQIQGGISLLSPHAKFSGSDTIGGATLSGSQGGDAVASVATAGLYGVWRINPRWRFGFAVAVPYGQRVSYDKNFVGRYQSLVSSITSVSFSPSISYKIDNHLSIGGGPVFNYFKTRMTSNLYLGSTLNGLVGNPIAEVRGDDLGFGYNIGLLYQFDADTRIGIDYRSRIAQELSGNRTIYVPAGLGSLSPATAAALNALTSSAKASMTLPDNLNLGIYHQLTPKLAVMGSVEWTDWSLLKHIMTNADNGTVASILPENWHDTWFFGVGINYKATTDLMLQTGFSYEQSPVTDKNRTTRIPDGDHYVFGIGATYTVMPDMDLSLAYAHIFVPKGHINESTRTLTGQTSTLVGHYDVSDDSVTAGMTIRF